jgi:uncharacterized caspase-like protein
VRRVLDTCLALLCALAASAPAGIAAPQREPSRRALLVGIEHYPPEIRWPTLEGPAHDVAAMHDVLVARFGFRSEDVEELHDEAATHAGIAAAFDRLVQRASADDLILFYFAGHGSRLPDDDPDEESDGWDPTLVPYDACAGLKRDGDIRDDEIARWIAHANEKTDQVVLVLDCGSTGPSDSGAGPERGRCLSPEARGVALTAARAGSSVSSPKRSGWVPPRARCVALSACRSAECAFEVRVESPPPAESGPARSAVGLYRGLFTMSLIDELASIDSDASWEDLMLRVSARVAARTARQSPVIEGALAGCGLFRGVAAARAPRFEADLAANGRLRVHAGLERSLAPGAVIAVCSSGAARDDASARLGEAEIVDATADEATARWRRTPAAAANPGPCRAFLLQGSESPAPLPVSIEGDAAGSAALAGALEATRLLRRVDPAGARYRVVASQDPPGRGWRVLDADGRALSAVAEDSPVGIGRLVGALSTLARARRLEQILGSSLARDLRTRVAVKLLGEARADGSRATLGEPEKDGEDRLRIAPGQAWCVTAVNRSDVPIYANFVLVFPDGRIVVPCAPCPDDRIPPGGAAARCAPDPFAIPTDPESFRSDAPVRLYCVWTPRWHDFSALQQGGFSLAASSSGADSWSASELGGETWTCDEMEIAVR